MFTARLHKFGMVILLLIIVQRYMPGAYYTGDTVNYIYERVWAIDQPKAHTRLTYKTKTLTGKEKLYRNSLLNFKSNILRKMAGGGFGK